ncbi:lipid A export permease/ATP-binding protein MsbA [Sutterella megalosphaeroides]|uniref:Lipid A export ATP-binding/permease protein MsbA n=1 Tax=Sutterella megalosphaeroides TaxID=2494234 RepID=A0A2Z6IBZ6_9BURK|nr:lipid A export permease/ATP-binding protein MsbA [Sutterella megalosphaeroides]BBF22598.1 lipid A export ATP-binding/permease protein MsbA [Sutterella megalosphaeroides]
MARFPVLSNPYLMRLFRYLPPYKWYIAGAAAAMAAGGGASSLIALILGKLTDMGFYQQDPIVAVLAPIALIGVAALNGGSQYLSSYLLVRVSQSIMLEIRTLMFERISHWSDELFFKYRCSEVQAKFINEASTALSRAASVMTTMIRDSIQIVCLIGVLIYHNWKLTLVTFVVAPLLAAVLRWVSKRMKKLTSQTQQTFGQLLGTIQESYQGERVVKIYDGYDYERDRFRAVNEKLKDLTLRTQRVEAAGTPLTQLIAMSGVSVVVVYALAQAQSGALTIGEFTTFLSAMLLLMPPIRHLSSLNGTTAAMTAAAESLFAMIDEEPEKDPGEKTLEDYRGAVRFENVCFAYPNTDKPAVKNFNLDVKPGEMIALVGSSGSGKSTLINLIPRFWAATSGDIYFDGVPQSELTLASLRRQIGLVSQEVTIFDDTIAGNIAYGCRDKVTREDIERAAEAAALTDFIATLPQGLDTPVGANGSMLSGGQRQRISIARAFLKNAPILLLDEATSALDTESERHIQKSLDSLLKGRTAFVVAHRLSTIVNADRIVVMREGEIVEIGTHEELLEKKGVYEHLYSIQFKNHL